MASIRGARALVAGCLLAGALIAPGAARARPTGPVPSAIELAGVNVLKGTHTSVVDVHVPTPAVFSGDVDDFAVEGAGKLPGFVLTTMPVSDVVDHPLFGEIKTTPAQDVVVAASRLPGAGVFAGPDARRELILFPMKTVIEPGYYRLYLIADGSPVTVRFELKGLLGTRVIEPAERVPFVSKELPERTSAVTPAGAVYVGGDYAPLRKPGMVFHALVVEVDDFTAGEFGHCVFRGKPPSEEELGDASYTPRCITASSEGYSSYFSAVRPDRPSGKAMQYGLVSTLEPDYWTQLTEFEGAATVGRAGSLGYWLSW